MTLPRQNSRWVDASGYPTREFYDWARRISQPIEADSTTPALNDISDVTITNVVTGEVLKFNGTSWVNDTDATGGGGVSDGDKGDIVVSGSGATYTIDSDAVTFAKMQNIATAKLLGRGTAGTGNIEEITLGTNLSFAGTTLNATGGGGATNLAYTAAPTNGTVTSDTGTDATLSLADGTNAGLMAPAQHTKLAGIASGATANSSDATLLSRANHTGTQAASTISDFDSASRAQTEAELAAGANITITPSGSGATRVLTIAATGGGGGGISLANALTVSSMRV